MRDYLRKRIVSFALDSSSMNATIRTIADSDNECVAAIIRSVMTDYDCVGPGFSIEDSEVDAMYDAYQADDRAFFVIEVNGEVLGVGGLGPLVGASVGTCEVKKMYFLQELRGKGWGSALLTKCLVTARSMGYRYCYIETVAHMTAANGLYKKHGFKQLDRQLGATGHGGCDLYYGMAL